MNLRKLRVVAGIAAVAAVFATAAPASSLPRYTETFDCDTYDDGGYPYLVHALAPGQSLTVAITSCGGMPVAIESGTVILNGIDVTEDGYFEVPGDTSRITVTAGTELWVPEYVSFIFDEAKVVASPSGTLLDTETVTVGRNPKEFVAGTTRQIESGSTTYLDKNKECDLRAGEHIYATSTFEVTEKGTYSLRVVATDPVDSSLAFHTADFHPFNDMFAAVYPDHERPWNPASKKLVGCNDDANDSWSGYVPTYTTDYTEVVNSRNPWVTMKLKPGKYTVMWTTFQGTSTLDWSRGNYGDFNPGKSTFTYEVWGPSGALVG